MVTYHFAEFPPFQLALKGLADNTFTNVLPSLHNVLQYLDAVAFPLWDVNH